MTIFVTGGTGFVGTRLVERLAAAGHHVVVLTRRMRKTSSPGIEFVEGDPVVPGPWQNRVAGADCIINLAGASISQRWNDAVKKELRDSRILTTRHIVDAMPVPSLQTLISTSAVGYYGFHGDEEIREYAPAGTDFLAVLARDWEAEAMKAADRGARVVITRFGLVIGERGGLLGSLVPLFKKMLGGPVGSGNQWFSWVHIDDLIEAFLFILSRPGLRGPVNVTAPRPVRNRELAAALGVALGVPAFLPAPAFAVRIALGEFAEVVLNGQKVLPAVLAGEGFAFSYPEIGPALKQAVAAD